MAYCAGDGRSCALTKRDASVSGQLLRRRPSAGSCILTRQRAIAVPGRVLIAEPSLFDGRGHQAAAVRRFVELIGPGKTAIAAGARWNGPRSMAGARVVPLLKHHRQEVARMRRYGPLLGKVLTIADLAAAPVAELVRRRRDGPTSGSTVAKANADGASMASMMIDNMRDCLKALCADADDRLFLPSADAELLLAAAEVLNTNECAPRMHLRLMYDDVGCHPTDPTWRSVLAVLARARHARERVHLLAETNAFARAVREVWEGPVALLPHPSDLTPSAPPPMAEGFALYVPGQPRGDKGFHLLSAVAQSLAARAKSLRRPVRMLIHGDIPAGSAEAIKVERLPNHVSQPDYETNWHRSHAALMLHDPRIYALRGSGVACDAVAGGRPFVCLKGTSLCEWGADGNVLVAEPNPDSIADAVGRLLENYDDYARASRIAAARFPKIVRAGLAGLVDTQVEPQSRADQASSRSLTAKT